MILKKSFSSADLLLKIIFFLIIIVETIFAA